MKVRAGCTINTNQIGVNEKLLLYLEDKCVESLVMCVKGTIPRAAKHMAFTTRTTRVPVITMMNVV